MLKDLEELIETPTFEQIQDWAYATFIGIPTIHTYSSQGMKETGFPKYLLEAWDKENNHVVIRADEGVFQLICGAYMIITGWKQ